MNVQHSSLQMDKTMAEMIGWAVDKSLHAMTGINSEVGKFSVVPQPSLQGEIFGITNIRTDRIEGVFIMTFPQETLSFLMSKAYGEAFKNSDPHNTLAEFSSVIYELIKMGLDQRGIKIQMSLPTVITGNNLQIMSQKKGPYIQLPVKIEQHPFQVLFFMCELGNAAKAA